MTVQGLAKKYGMCEEELLNYASCHLRSFRRRGEKGETRKLTGQMLRQLDWLLANEGRQDDEPIAIEDLPPRKIDDDWAHDPTEDEPDDSEVPPPMEAPEQEEKPQEAVIRDEPKAEPVKTAEDKKPHDLSELAEKAWEKEKSAMYARMEELQQELAALRHTNLKMQSSTAEKQAELLAKTIQERQLAEERIALMKQDAASVKHLSNVRIKELEDRNAELEEQVKSAHNELTNVSADLISAQRVIQEIKDNANKQGAEQKLQLLDAQHKQDELFKIIHEKEIELTDEKEKFQDLMEKYNGALLRMGDMIGKIEKARTRMQEISAEFDVFVNSDTAAEARELSEAKPPVAEIEEKKPEQIAAVPEIPVQQQIPKEAPQQAPNPETIEVLGKPLHEIYPEKSPLKEQAKPQGLWRKIASFF